jgi:hypothetical protein
VAAPAPARSPEGGSTGRRDDTGSRSVKDRLTAHQSEWVVVNLVCATRPGACWRPTAGIGAGRGRVIDRRRGCNRLYDYGFHAHADAHPVVRPPYRAAGPTGRGYGTYRMSGSRATVAGSGTDRVTCQPASRMSSVGAEPPDSINVVPLARNSAWAIADSGSVTG